MVKDYSKENAGLVDIYDHYPRHDKRFEAVCFLLANATNNYSVDDQENISSFINIIDSVVNVSMSSASVKDKDAALKAASSVDRSQTDIIQDYASLNSDSLVKSIDKTFETWETTPWHNQYTFDDFLNYVLPYRTAHEPLEYYWRWDCLSRFKVSDEDRQDIVKCANTINGTISFKGDPLLRTAAVQGYSLMLHSGMGKCSDRAMLVTMALRAYGIPAACESIPYWGSYNGGHSLCSAIMPDGSAMIFNTDTDEGDNASYAHKTPKVYRQMFAVQRNDILYKYRDKEDIPSPFSHFNLLDVTDKHAIGFADLKVNIPRRATSNNIVYLALFSPSGWEPIAYTENRGTATVFKNVGTGTNSKGKMLIRSDDFGDGILYLPCSYESGTIRPLADPVIHCKGSTYSIKPSTESTESVVLTRKFPLMTRFANFAKQMVGGVFEGAGNVDFAGSDILYPVVSTPLYHTQSVTVDSSKKYRYVRFFMAKGALCLAEMKFYDKSGKEIKGELISCDLLKNDPELYKVHDNSLLTYFNSMPLFDVWVGFKFDKPEAIGSISFCPRNDDNNVSPGDIYELFYWDNDWISFDVQEATDYKITFDDVPQGALLWLRNLTKGRQERPFTYENGRQVWW